MVIHIPIWFNVNQFTTFTFTVCFWPPSGTTLTSYRGEEEYSAGEPPTQKFNLTGAEAIPDIDVSKKRFAMNIMLPSSDETGEIRLAFENVRMGGSLREGGR